MEPNNVVDAVKEGAKFGTKMGEIALKIFGPWATKRQANADAYADARKIQTIRDNPDMDIVYVGGMLNARSKTPEALSIRAQQRQLQESIRQEENIESIFEKAIEGTENEDQIIIEDIDDDWVTRFFGHAKDISDENMQVLWAKILSEEIKKPRSFSLRTLDIVRNISKTEASLFQKILPLILCNGNDEYLLNDETLLKEYGLNYGDILTLEDCGLMNSSMAQFSVDVTGSVRLVFHKGTHAVVYIEENEEKRVKKISNTIYAMTTAGRELKKALMYDSNLEYLVKAAQVVRKNNGNINLSIHKTEFDSQGNLAIRKEPVMIVPD